MAPNLRGLVPHKKGEIGTHRQIPITGRQHEDTEIGTCLAVQWLRLHTPNAGCPGSIPGKGAISHMSQLKIPHTTNKTQTSQINKLKIKNDTGIMLTITKGYLRLPGTTREVCNRFSLIACRKNNQEDTLAADL